MRFLLSLLLVLFLSSISWSQEKIIVVDSLTKKPISFAEIYFSNEGTYSNIDGEFDLAKIKTDSLQINTLGYEEKKLAVYDIKDTIFIFPRINYLPPVTIYSNIEPIIIKSDKKAKNFSSHPIPPKTTIVTILYPKINYENKLINQISVKFGKTLSRESRRLLRRNKTTAYIRLHAYTIENNKLSENIFNSEIIEIIPYKDQKIELDVSHTNISFFENGIGIEIEFIGFNLDEDLPENSRPKLYIRAALTDVKNDYFVAETFLRDVFQGDKKELYPINERYNHSKANHIKKYDRNLSIGFELK